MGILASTVVLIPVLSMIHRIFHNTWHVDWRLMLSVSAVSTLLFFAFFFVAQLLEFWREDTWERQSQSVFPAVMWVRGICLASIVMGLGLMVGTYREGDSPWIVLTPVVFVFLGFFAWPRAIEISENDIRQHRIFFGHKRISFQEIERAVSDPARNETIVFGNNGERIVHTMLHIQQALFNERLESLTAKHIYTVGDLDQNSTDPG